MHRVRCNSSVRGKYTVAQRKVFASEIGTGAGKRKALHWADSCVMDLRVLGLHLFQIYLQPANDNRMQPNSTVFVYPKLGFEDNGDRSIAK